MSVSKESYDKALKLTNGTLEISFSLSTDRTDSSDTVGAMRRFLSEVDKVAKLLNVNPDSLILRHNWEHSDHEVASKVISFKNEVESGKHAMIDDEKILVENINHHGIAKVKFEDGSEDHVPVSRLEPIPLHID